MPHLWCAVQRLRVWRCASCHSCGLPVRFQSIVPTIPEPQVKEVVVPLFHKFAEDDQDSVRLLSVPVVAPLVQALNHADMMTVVLPALLALAHDSSWRVRYMVADYITKVQPSILLC